MARIVRENGKGKRKYSDRNSFFGSYLGYLRSSKWAGLRRHMIERQKHCQHCGSKDNLEVHHKFYRKHWTDTVPADLIVLCRNCHVQEELKRLRNKRSERIVRILQGSQDTAG